MLKVAEVVRLLKLYVEYWEYEIQYYSTTGSSSSYVILF